MQWKKYRAIAKKRWYAVVAALAVIGVLAFNLLSPSNNPDSISLSKAESHITAQKISKAEMRYDDHKIVLTYKKTGEQREATYPNEYDDKLIALMKKHDVEYTSTSRTFLMSVWQYLKAYLFLIVMLIIWGITAVRNRRKSTKEVSTPPKERLSDVGANEEVKKELGFFIDGITHPERYGEKGLKPIKGILLFGPPGTGKTLLARAVAGQAGVPFFYTSGADLTAEYSGQSQARVRRAFERAQKAAKLANKPAILFVDEVDAIAARRTDRDDSTSRDRDSTLTQLLTCMDGFSANEVIVIAATNKRDVLDESILRPGRLTKQVMVPLPDRAGREDILRLCIGKFEFMQLDDEEIARLADATAGMSGSGIAELVNEAGTEAYRTDSLDSVTWSHFREAMLTHKFGPVRQLDDGDKIARQSTVREARRAVVAMALSTIPNPFLISTQVRGDRNGMTLVPEHPEGYPQAIEEILERITFLVSGRAAEKMLDGGSHSSTTNADIEEATKLAFEVVCNMDASGEIVQYVNYQLWYQHPQAGRISVLVDNILREAEARASKIIVAFPEEVAVIEDRLKQSGGLLEGDFLAEFNLKEPRAGHDFGFVGNP